ncbi:DUF4249 domain-containing protein [Flectobacillus longus]|uniref:DUF4249 domain-containing protein n=1 Tax=Flectobacillus longus TaxID=2984207 RepID=UPI0024B6C170|nr:DUF4249 domain-containing protein [Flectobacillus longus]MDI9882494.1 DUF4249 domain-containing protein [Flectobacillus longus]
MKRYSYFYIIIFVVFNLIACINPVSDFEQAAYLKFITVEASLSDLAEAQRVKLYWSADRIDGTSGFTPITGAKVWLTTASGSTINYLESGVTSSKGVYSTPDTFKGVIGETYTLHFRLSNGKEYESSPEKMRNSPEIENLITRFEINDVYGKADPRRAGFNVYADFQDDPASGDYYQWFWKHYERAEYCITCYSGAKYNFSTSNCEPPRIPTDEVWNYVCNAPCWNMTFSNDLNIMSDALMNGQRLTGKKVARVPFDNYSNYYLRLEQRAITKDAYDYYQSLSNQTQNTGTLFDVPAETRFSLNIKSKTDASEKLLGIFDVYSVKKRVFYIDRQTGVPAEERPLMNYTVGEVYTCPPGAPNCQDRVPCLEGLYRTPFKPEGWTD